jgi:hypothetical protein
MRLLIVVGLAVLALAQERAEVIKPIQIDHTVRTYQISGFAVTLPPTIYKPPTTPTVAPPVLVVTNLTIRYVDNLGTEAVDVHTDDAAAKLIRDLIVAPTASGTVTARLLQHLVGEGKIPAARITITK